MNGKKKGLILVLVFVLVLGGAYALYQTLGSGLQANQLATQQPKEEDQGEAEKTKAPDFTVYDENGTAVQLASYFGKPIVLNFWASCCGPCQRQPGCRCSRRRWPAGRRSSRRPSHGGR